MRLASSVFLAFEGQSGPRLASSGARRTPARLLQADDGTRPTSAPGLVGAAFQFTGGGGLDLGQLFEFRRSSGFTFGAWVKFSDRGGCVINKISPEQEMRGLDLSVVEGRATFQLVHRWPQAAIKVTTTARYPSNRWLHLMVTYDGSSDPRGIYIYFNGQSQELAVNHHTELLGSIRTSAPVLVGNRPGGAPFHGLIDDVQVYKWPLSFRDLSGVLYRKMDQIVVLPPQQRSTEQAEFIESFFRQHVHRPTISLQR